MFDLYVAVCVCLVLFCISLTWGGLVVENC